MPLKLWYDEKGQHLRTNRHGEVISSDNKGEGVVRIDKNSIFNRHHLQKTPFIDEQKKKKKNKLTKNYVHIKMPAEAC